MYKTLIYLLLLVSCSTGQLYPPSQKFRDRLEYVSHSSKAMISTAHPLASEAGLKMLKMGGNAMDAAAAVSFVISVVRPQSTGIGGGGFTLYFDAKSKSTVVYDFRERAPSRATQKMYLDTKGEEKDFYYKGKKVPNASVNGHLSVGVPGMVAGVIESHKKYGRLSLAKVIQPAIDIAEKGFPVYESLASAILERQEIMLNFEDSKKIFYPNGKALQLGDKLIQTDLAWTLKQIQKNGEAGFYKGEVAKRIIAEIQKGKGLLSQKDLNQYKVKMRTPVSGTYRGFTVVSMPPPSSGGVHIIEMLNILEGYPLKKLGHNTPQGAHILAETMRRAFADRAEYLGDPDFVKVPTKGLVSKTYATELRKTIDENKATPSSVIKAGNPAAFESKSTTHFSIVDQWGNAVSSTQTVNYTFGSCVVAEGTGIILNDEMDDFSKKPGVPNVFGLVGSKANAVAANKTMLSSMTPTLVFKGGEIAMVVGSPGGPRIISATLQTILNYIDHRMDLTDAVHAYRIHHQWLPDQIRIEKDGLSGATIEALEKMGHKVTVIEEPIGAVQAIAREKDGWIGVTDTRTEGRPMGF